SRRAHPTTPRLRRASAACVRNNGPPQKKASGFRPQASERAHSNPCLPPLGGRQCEVYTGALILKEHRVKRLSSLATRTLAVAMAFALFIAFAGIDGVAQQA